MLDINSCTVSLENFACTFYVVAMGRRTIYVPTVSYLNSVEETKGHTSKNVINYSRPVQERSRYMYTCGCRRRGKTTVK